MGEFKLAPHEGLEGLMQSGGNWPRFSSIDSLVIDIENREHFFQGTRNENLVSFEKVFFRVADFATRDAKLNAEVDDGFSGHSVEDTDIQRRGGDDASIDIKQVVGRAFGQETLLIHHEGIIESLRGRA
jgi:hypothetical protein